MLDGKVGDFCEAIQNDYMHKRTVQIIMYLKDLTGEIKISDEHIDWTWTSADEMKKLDLSTTLKKIMEKRDWMI